MALHTLLVDHLQKTVGNGGYTVSGATATITASLDHRQMDELLRVASQIEHDFKLVSGSPKILPR